MKRSSEREIAVFSAARRLSTAERAAFLDESCGDDVAFRTRIVELLKAAEMAGNFLREPELAETVREPAGTRTEEQIGRYKLLQKLGEGGCGVVYMAEQVEPVRRRVALKLIKLGMDTKQVIARFSAERQALAMMDHPNISKVLDAGATSLGRPYFVMELVRGIKITEYCDQNQLPIEQRMDLFLQVCRAIQHAHEKGIIHRDIKPSNILVTLHDGEPVPKVIDFGIAKATQGRLTDQTLFTAFEQFLGTPAYMSPEQAEMSELEVDTRSDIYSLGVLFYELISGKPPFEQTELVRGGLDAMRRMVRETEPPRPSTKVSSLASQEMTTIATCRQVTPPKLVQSIRGDLDCITMKCLEKNRNRRYSSVLELAGDVRRFLHDEPIHASPPSLLYRAQKLVRRNKIAVIAGSAVVFGLILGLVLATWLVRSADQQPIRSKQDPTVDLTKEK